MSRNYTITLTPAERRKLSQLAVASHVPVRQIRCAQILLKADTNQQTGGWTDLAISQAFDISLPAIERVRRRFVEARLAAILKKQPHSTAAQPPRQCLLATTAISQQEAEPVTDRPVRTNCPSPFVRAGKGLGRQQRSKGASQPNCEQQLRLPGIVSPLVQGRWIWTGAVPAIMLMLTGGLAWGSWRWLVSLPPEFNCNHLTALTVTDAERLHCANQLARRRDVAALSSALDFFNQMPAEAPLLTQAQDLAEEWSKSSLLVAQQQAEQGNFKRATALLQKVPQSSSVYDLAQESIQSWRQRLTKGERLLQTARTELQHQEWTQAMIQVQKLSSLGGPYWQGRADQLLDEIILARKVAQRL